MAQDNIFFTLAVEMYIQNLAAASSSKKDATATLLAISISDRSFIIHSSKEHLLCNKSKSFKNISYLCV